jgi:UDPglucose 6-dehydrogenase
MNIGIVGLGIVGSAIKFGFEKLGNTVHAHDKKLDTKLEDLLGCEIIYLCVPTNQSEDGSCDTSIVEECVDSLSNLKYAGVVAIKSTVVPGTTSKLMERYGDHLSLAFVPEFLRERCALYDFVENNTLLAVGTECNKVYDIVLKSHGSYFKDSVMLKPTEAEMLKYYSNVFNALRIIFANEVYEVCEALGADYTSIKNAFIRYSGLEDKYLDVNDNFRGYGGTCLPKDVKALAKLTKDLNLNMSLFDLIDSENSKFERTVFEGMRL